MQLRGVTFRKNSPNRDEKEMSAEDAYKVALGRTPEITPEIFKQIQEEKSRHEMGVIAQEVEKVVPEVVRTREDGLKSVAYSEMVGLLIEAIKEQQHEIAVLQTEVDKLQGGVSSDASFRSASNLTGITGTVDPGIANCRLYQNTPNPFKDGTEIHYQLSPEVQSADIYIFSVKGDLLKRYPAPPSGVVEIKGSHLHAGMYIYTLVVDGQPVDSKRMLLTK